MLRLQLPTDPRWAAIAEAQLPKLLSDHAWCEQKAASNAISIVVVYPQHSDLVQAMVAIAQEELQHFAQVHAHLQARGWPLEREQRDDYVQGILGFMRKGGSPTQQLLERLLFAALIEARSCERFQVLAAHFQTRDAELAAFYQALMASEAEHYRVFLGFARQYAGRAQADARWAEFLAFEGQLIQRFGQRETMHG